MMERLCNSVISNVLSEVCNALESDNKPETNGCDNLETFFLSCIRSNIVQALVFFLLSVKNVHLFIRLF